MMPDFFHGAMYHLAYLGAAWNSLKWFVIFVIIIAVAAFLFEFIVLAIMFLAAYLLHHKKATALGLAMIAGGLFLITQYGGPLGGLGFFLVILGALMPYLWPGD